MNRQYHTRDLPHYVHDYFGRPLTMERIDRYMWLFEGPKNSATIVARTATMARDKVRYHVVGQAPTMDQRRVGWQSIGELAEAAVAEYAKKNGGPME
jgi:hypothetical protein